MRLLKGSKVEVLTRNEVPTGAWCSAVIISGNGHTYSVRYDRFPITGESASVERVPRKSIRPCPPPTNRTDDWVPGDVVEVFDESCWKPAQIVRVSGENKFSVRIIGSNSEFEAHRSWLRARQAWEDGNWFLVGKSSSNSSLPKRKRSSLGFSDVGVQKKRIIVRIPSPVCKKVDEFVFPNIIDDTMSCASSVGSCSGLGSNGLNLSPSYCENLEDYCSDADSYCERRYGEEESSSCSSGGLEMDIRRSELHAYQQALKELYNSRSLTLEEEAKYMEFILGNILMLSLNISSSLLEASIHSFKSHDWV